MADLITLGVEVQTTGGAQAAQGLGSFEKAAQSAAGAADELENKVNALGAAQSKSTAPAKAMASAVGGIGAAFKNNASSIQNASFQISDVIVQVTGGTSAARALGMQLPQLLGGFGPLGAVLGVVAGVLFSVVPLLFSTANGAEDLKTATDGLTDAMNAFGSATKAANQDFSDLRNTYGANSDAAQHFLEIQREIADLQARQAFGKASAAVAAAGQGSLAGYSAADLDRLSKQYAIYNVGLETASVEIAKLEGLSRDLTSTEQARLDQLYEQQGAYLDAKTAALDYTIGVAELEKKLGAAEGTGSDLAAAFAQLSEARTFEDQSRAAQHLSEMILAATDGLREATPEGVALSEVLVNTVMEALKLEQLSYGKGGLDDAAVSASKLADEINRAASNAITLSAQSLTARTEAEIRLKFKGDTVGEQRALAETRFPVPKGLPDAATADINRKRDEYIANMTAAAEAQKALADFNKEVKSGAKSTSTAAADIKRYYDATRTDGEKYADGLKELGALHASGAMDADLYARSIEDLNLKFDPLGKLISGLADTVENELNAAFASVLDGTKSLGEALLDFAGNVLAKVAQDLFAQQFSAPIAAGIKGLFSADGNVFDQRGYVPFAKGGVVSEPIAAGIKGLFSEDGNVFDQRGYVPFAKGGVVSGPTIFPFANGTGLMGEAGPEAIMPLSRGADGRLGIAASVDARPPIIINDYSAREGLSASLVDAIKDLARVQQKSAQVVPFSPDIAVRMADPIPARQPTAAQEPAKGAAQPKITINNYSGQEASASTDNMGNIIVEIGRAIAQDITGGGPTYRAIKSTFGISNRLQQRG